MPELTKRRRMLVLAICCLSLLIVGMDNTIVNIALPSIRTDLNASVEGLQWTVDSYTLVLASLLILAGSSADRLGRRRTFQIGLVLFTLGSLLCSLAPGLGWLIVFRMVQAVGGSMLNPVAMSIITNVFTEPAERARAIGIWGGVIGISLGVGPIVGGLLTETVGWRAIFWINVPIGLAAVVLAALFVPESRAPRPRRVDPIGQLLVLFLLASVTYAIINGPRAGWGSLETWALFGLAVLAALALLRYEPRRIDPLIELRFFRSVPFSAATVIAICAFGAFSGFLFLNTLYLQDVRQLSALHAGLLLLPMALVTALLAPVSGRIVGSRGPRVPLFLAGVAMCAGGLALTGLDRSTGYGWLVSSYVMFAIGFGMVNAPVTNTAVSGMPRSQAGVAAAVASTSRQVGAALGVAIIGSVINTGSSGAMAGDLVSASRPGWWIIVGAGACVLVLGVASTGRRAQRSADRTAELFSAETAAAEPAMLSTS
ncbi:MFS transporter [Jatrophihabitans sp.]|jgi:EmrB/QacA subfamily drug resistance transporter|uniref:MFS transporter n=1 Tax=Jatrophihabitans sp. TaxID=1932789 RepID=UPI002EF93C52